MWYLVWCLKNIYYGAFLRCKVIFSYFLNIFLANTHSFFNFEIIEVMMVSKCILHCSQSSEALWILLSRNVNKCTWMQFPDTVVLIIMLLIMCIHDFQDCKHDFEDCELVNKGCYTWGLSSVILFFCVHLAVIIIWVNCNQTINVCFRKASLKNNRARQIFSNF